MTVYGIDLGTTYSCLAKIDPMTGQPKIIEDAGNGSVSLPSAVAFPTDQDGVIIGAAAKQMAVEQPERVFQFFKRYMGRSNPDRPNYDQECPSYNIDGVEYTPVTLSSMVLKQIIKYASESGEAVHDVIITVPAYFSLDQRAATKEAGELAGLNVLATINEPTAAALAFAQGQLPENRLMLVYDLGGGTFDVTLLRLTPRDDGSYDAEVLVTDGNHKLGGADWDQRLFSILKSKYATQMDIPEEEINPEDLNELAGACEGTKQALSRRDTCNLKAAGCKLTVTREEFDAATQDLLQQSVDLLENLLAVARDKKGVDESQITDILMVGGSTRMPQVMNMLYSRFGEERVRFNDPERAVALGAAVASLADLEQLRKYDTVIELLKRILKGGGGGGPETPGSLLTMIHVDLNGGLTGEGANGEPMDVPQELASFEVPGEMYGRSYTVAEFLEEVENHKGSNAGPGIRDVAPSTFGLIIRRNGMDHAVDNVIPKGSPTGVEVTRRYGTPEGNYSALVLPVVQSDSQSDYDPCERVGNDYTFPGSVDRHMEVGRLELPLPSSIAPRTPVDVNISFDRLANLRITMVIPSLGIQKDLEINFGSSAEEFEEQKKQIDDINLIDAI